MAHTIVVTGYPGFLGSALLPRLLSREPDADAVCIVQDRFADLARRRADEQMAADPALDGRIRCLVGDITATDLGLGSEAHRTLASTTTHDPPPRRRLRPDRPARTSRLRSTSTAHATSAPSPGRVITSSGSTT